MSLGRIFGLMGAELGVYLTYCIAVAVVLPVNIPPQMHNSRT